MTNSIKDWMDIFSDIYKAADADRTPEQIWIAIMAHASKIGESIRTFSIQELSKSSAHTFCWLCSFINKCNTQEHNIFSLNETLSSIVTLKYPGVCGHCRKNVCVCDSVTMDKGKDKSAAYTELLDLRSRLAFPTYGLKDFFKIFKDTYEARLHIQSLESIGFHFLEEIGEAAFAVRKLSQLQKIHTYNIKGIDTDLYDNLTTVESIVTNYQKHYETIKKFKEHPETLNNRDTETLIARVIEAKIDLLVEIGDTFSWFCAISNKLSNIEQSIWEKPEEHVGKLYQNLEVTLMEEYHNDGKYYCPNCKSTSCTCAFFNEPVKK
jgi:hypothetical protein